MLLNVANFFARWTLLFQSLKKSPTLVSSVHKIDGFFKSWNFVRRFTLWSAVGMLLGMIGIGWWVGEEIKASVIKEATATTALYMDSFIAPNVQGLAQNESITPERVAHLESLFSGNNLGQQTVSVKIWSRDHTIVFSNIPQLIGRKFPDTTDLISSFNGHVTGEISNLQEAENIEERRLSKDPLLEIYSPVRENGTNRVIAVAEFYQKIDNLDREIIAAQRRGWLLVGTTLGVVYLLLVGFVQWAGNRIGQQESELKNQVAQLTELLRHNKDLYRQVRLAAANTATLNEDLLRRISAELHDGPIQEVSLALLRLDQAIAQNEECRFVNSSSLCNQSLPTIQILLQASLQEMRSIATSLGLPQLDNMPLTDVVIHAVKAHEQRTHTEVILKTNGLPEQTSLSVKIATYRFIQEGLNNAFRHADGKGQEVHIVYKSSQMQIEVMDHGPGFNPNIPMELEDHLGLASMQERIESLGGSFNIDSNMEKGSMLTVRLPLQNQGEI